MITSHEGYGVVVTSHKGLEWIEGPFHTEGAANTVSDALTAFGCTCKVLPINPTHQED